jgi:succinate dehydrogenase / fumarate reductase cytochrome b subunit
MKPKLIDTQVLHKNRPLSPHLSIYKPQLTSVLSILHRITGAYLYLGLSVLTWVIFTMVYFPYCLEDLSQLIYSNLITKYLFKLMLLGWAFSLFYHQLNGIRHLFWDVGKGFDLKTAYVSGRLVLAGAILLTLACWYVVCVYASPIDMMEVR